jgi:drug/metabolite transporter (DMT)-like permease
MQANTKLALLTLSSALLSICVKVLTPSLGAFQQMALRMLPLALAGSYCLLGGGAWRRAVLGDAKLFMVRSFLLTIFGGGFYILAMKSCKVGVVSFLSCLPFEAAWGCLLFRERLNLPQSLGYLIAIYGIWTLSDVQNIDPSQSLGLVYAALSGITWGLGVALGRKHSADLSSSQITVISFWLGAGWSFGASPLAGEFGFLPDSLFMYGVLLASCLFVAATCWLMNDLAREISMTRLALAGLVQPGLAGILAWLLLGESFSQSEIFGSLWILLGSSLFFLEPGFLRLGSKCEEECRTAA